MRAAVVVVALLVVAPSAVFAYAKSAPPAPARHGWVAYIVVGGDAGFSLAEVALPADVSSVATARAAATRIAVSRYGAEAGVQGLFQWDSRSLWPRWTGNGWSGGGS